MPFRALAYHGQIKLSKRKASLHEEKKDKMTSLAVVKEITSSFCQKNLSLQHNWQSLRLYALDLQHLLHMN